MLQYELNFLQLNVGQTIAEKKIKQNGQNYQFHYPEKEDPYAIPKYTYIQKKQMEYDKKREIQRYDPRKIDPHLLMHAVQRQTKMTKKERKVLFER